MTEATDEIPETIWVKTQPTADGRFLATLEIGNDSIPLGPERAVRYATAVLTAVAIAQFDAAVVNQMYELGIKRGVDHDEALQTAAQLLADLRAGRDADIIPVVNTLPLEFRPSVSGSNMRPYLLLMRHDLPTGGEDHQRAADFAAGGRRESTSKPVGQWTIEDAQQHAIHVMEAVMIADLDAEYLQILVQTLGIPEGTARNVIADLGRHYGGTGDAPADG